VTEELRENIARSLAGRGRRLFGGDYRTALHEARIGIFFAERSYRASKGMGERGWAFKRGYWNMLKARRDAQILSSSAKAEGAEMVLDDVDELPDETTDPYDPILSHVLTQALDSLTPAEREAALEHYRSDSHRDHLGEYRRSVALRKLGAWLHQHAPRVGPARWWPHQ
jgi:hypothetical protein